MLNSIKEVNWIMIDNGYYKSVGDSSVVVNSSDVLDSENNGKTYCGIVLDRDSEGFPVTVKLMYRFDNNSVYYKFIEKIRNELGRDMSIISCVNDSNNKVFGGLF